MENEANPEALDDLGLNEPTSLDDISRQLDSIENELLLLNEKADKGQFKEAERLLFFILLVLIYIAIK